MTKKEGIINSYVIESDHKNNSIKVIFKSDGTIREERVYDDPGGGAERKIKDALLEKIIHNLNIDLFPGKKEYSLEELIKIVDEVIYECK